LRKKKVEGQENRALQNEKKKKKKKKKQQTEGRWDFYWRGPAEGSDLGDEKGSLFGDGIERWLIK